MRPEDRGFWCGVRLELLFPFFRLVDSFEIAVTRARRSFGPRMNTNPRCRMLQRMCEWGTRAALAPPRARVPNSASKGPEWARFMAELHAYVPDEIRNLLKELNLNRSRRLDLFRVKGKISITYRHVSSVFSELQPRDLDSIWTPRALPHGFGLRRDSGCVSRDCRPESVIRCTP